MNVRGLSTSVRQRIAENAGARGVTTPEYIERLVRLHEALRQAHMWGSSHSDHTPGYWLSEADLLPVVR